jgi:hypothetical protein
MAFLLILFVALLIAAIMVCVSKRNSKPQKSPVVCATRLRNVVMSSNPVDGIHFGGVMGFALGDSYEFCLSRFTHLDISVCSVDKTGANSMILVWGKGVYENINEVRFIFDNKKLASIIIDIDFSKEGIRDMYGILISRICRVLKTEPILSDSKQTAWASPKSGIILFRHLVPIAEEENLLVQIGNL